MLNQVSYHKMIKTGLAGVGMKKNWRYRMAKATGSSRSLDRKVLRIKRSWDEVEDILNKTVIRRRKRRYH